MLDFNVALNKNTHTDQDHIETTNAPPPAARDPFDVSAYRAALKPYEDELRRMLAIAESLQVVDEATLKTAIEMTAQFKRVKNALEVERKKFVKPFQDANKAANNATSVYTEICEQGEKYLRPKISQEMTRQKIEKLEAERRAQKAAEELQAKLDAESAEKGLPQVEVPMPVLNQKTGPVRTEEGSASQRKVWKWKITDPAAVPREYLQVDTAAINSAVRAGARTIPGIEIYQEENVQIRF